MRWLYILVIFLFAASHAITQCKHPDIRVFEDYSQCLSGLKDSKGTVLVEPQYESIIALYTSNSKQFFIVEKQGLQGIINCDLEEVAPPIYTSLEHLSKIKEVVLFSASLNDQKGIIDETGNSIVPVEYQSVKPFYQNLNNGKYKRYWAVQKNGLFGLLNDQGEAIIPNQFTALSMARNAGRSRWDKNSLRTNKQLNYLQVRNAENKLGLLKFNGDTLLPLEYSFINIQTYNGGDFIVVKTDNEMRVLDTLGNLIDARENASRATVNWFKKDGKYISPFIQYTLDDPERSTVIVNVESEKTVQIKGTLTLRHGIITQSQSNAILNHHLDTIKLLGAKKIRWDKALSIEGLNVYTFENGEEFTGIFNENGVHLFEAPNTDAYVTGESKGLKIWLREREPSLDPPVKNQKGSLTVMDRNGKIINKWSIESCYGISSFVNRYYADESERYYYEEVDKIRHNLLIVQSNGKWGALNKKGEVVIPFEYDEFLSYNMNGKNIIGYYFRKNGKKGMVSASGKIITPFIYDDFLPDYAGTGYNVMKRDGKFTVINQDSEVIIEAVDSVLSAGKPLRLQWNKKANPGISFPYLSSSRIQCFVEIEGYLYVIAFKDVYRYDTLNFEANSRSPAISTLLVNKKGKIVLRSTNELLTHRNFIVNRTENYQSTLYNESTLEPIMTLDSAKTFVNAPRGVAVFFENEMMGLLNDQGDAWIVDPKYYWIAPTPDTTKFWVKTTPMNEGIYSYYLRTEINELREGWELINTSNELLTAGYKMIGPAHASERNQVSTVYSEDSLAGILHNLELEVPPKYDYIEKSKRNYSWRLYKGDQYQLYSPYFGLSESYDRISQRPYGRLYIAQKGTNYSLFTIDTAIHYLMKDIPEDVFLEMNFLRLSQIASIRGEIPMDFTTISDSARMETFWPQKNEQQRWFFFSLLHENHVDVEKFEWKAPDYLGENVPFRLDLYNNAPSYSRGTPHTILFMPDVSYKNEPFLTIRSRYNNDWVYTKQSTSPRENFQSSSVYWQSTYTHFVQLEDKIDTVGLYDFFSNDAKTKEFIYSYLEHEINERQIFGVACPNNLPEIILELQDFWFFNRTGISFEGTASNTFHITIPYSELHKYADKRYKSISKLLKKEAKEYEKKRNKKRKPRFL